MIDEIQNLLDQYIHWLKDKTTLRQIDDWVEITTPYLDRHNDYLQIFARRHNGGYELTDDKYIIHDLYSSGCNLDSSKRKDLLQTTLNGFGVALEDDALVVHATAENFALKKHNLIQSMLAINDLFCLATPMVASLFLEDVTNWLELHKIRSIPKVKFTGKSGYDHLFDFAIPKSEKQPERIIKAMNRPNRDTAQALAFAWFDTKDVRPPDSRAYAFLNDVDQPVSASVADALKSYGVSPVFWKNREEVRAELAA